MRTLFSFTRLVNTALICIGIIFALHGEPIVITGALLPMLCGKPLHTIRVLDSDNKPIPFQIDEISPEGEYICDKGESPNTNLSNGILDSRDEIAFLTNNLLPVDSLAQKRDYKKNAATSDIFVEASNKRTYLIRIVSKSTFPLSSDHTITYDPVKDLVETPWYFAQFDKGKFHFLQAGIKSSGSEHYQNIAGLLHVNIFFKTLIGNFKFQLNQDNLDCPVKRYKIGQIRLIKRGDFSLHLSFLFRVSKAAVNQICYAQMVCVPVSLHAPIRFKSFFSEAYIEMAPAITQAGDGFTYAIPSIHASFVVGAKKTPAHVIKTNPNHVAATFFKDSLGYTWYLDAGIDSIFLRESSFFLRRSGLASNQTECGYKLSINDLPIGRYPIVNWIFFAHSNEDLAESIRPLSVPATIYANGIKETNGLIRARIGIAGKYQ